MKVILMRKIERLGEPGQQVEVADGYARNYLLPKQLAVPATAGHVRSLQQLKAQSQNREDRAKHEASALAERISTVQVNLKRRASEEEAVAAAAATPPAEVLVDSTAPTAAAARLFGSVTAQDLSDALAAQGISVQKKHILLKEPIKTLGLHRVPLRLHAEVETELTVTVEREA